MCALNDLHGPQQQLKVLGKLKRERSRRTFATNMLHARWSGEVMTVVPYIMSQWTLSIGNKGNMTCRFAELYRLE